MSDELVYDFAVESLFRGIGKRFTPGLKAQVKALGIDPDSKLLPGYPRELWVRVVDVIARGLGPGDPVKAHRDLGAAIASGFAETTLGKVMRPAVELMGVRRLLLRLPKNLTMSNNFLKVTVHEEGPQKLRVDLTHDVPSADFLCGVIEAMARYAGATQCTTTHRREGGLLIIDVSWAT